jgi:hypothetical protein
MFANDFSQAVEDGFQAFRQRGIRRLDAAAGDIGKLVARLGDNAEAGDSESGIDA